MKSLNEILTSIGVIKNYERMADSDPEVRYISWYLRKNCRRLENSYHTITYRDLDTILESFGFFLSDPSGNRINIYKREKRRKLFSKEHKMEVVRVCPDRIPWLEQASQQGRYKISAGET